MALRSVPNAAVRQTLVRNRKQSQTQTFAPPIRGWIRNENLAASGPAGAYVLDNFFPTSNSVRLRGGSNKYATIGTTEVKSLFTYKSGATEKFFAADINEVFDITSVADPDVAPSADITGQTSGEYGRAQIGTAGGDYLVICNGDDTPQLYDGSSWAALSITGPTMSTLSTAWVFGKRLFFVEKNTQSIHYLAVNSISGAATEFSLAGVFQSGGSVLFGATWSLDTGAGLDDKCVIVSDTGEFAIYEGFDPASWTLVGVYQIAKPLGINATMKAGGDLIIATEEGMVPISEAIRKDVAALSLAAISKQIESEWAKEYDDRKSKNWEILKWTSNNMAIVSLPVINATTPARCFVVNLETGAWCRFTGWETQCLGIYNELGHFGDSDGKIYQMEVGGSDDGSSYTGTYVGLFEHLKTPAYQKIIHSARSVFILGQTILPQITISKNYAVSLPPVPTTPVDVASAVWDSAKWDVDVWDYSPTLETKTQWFSIGDQGFAIAPQLQITNNTTAFPSVELVAIDLMYEVGGVYV